jgi:hypothetical protein
LVVELNSTLYGYPVDWGGVENRWVDKDRARSNCLETDVPPESKASGVDCG